MNVDKVDLERNDSKNYDIRNFLIVLIWILLVALIFLQKLDGHSIWTLGLGLGSGLAVCLVMGLVVTVAIYMVKRIHIESRKEVLIFVNRFLHYLIIIFNIFYVVIFTAKSDIVFLIYAIMLIMHWIFCYGECILTYMEKKLLNPGYKIGEAPYRHEWVRVWATEKYMSLVMLVFTLLFTFNIGIVVRRSDVIHSWLLKVAIILLLCSILLYNNLQSDF